MKMLICAVAFLSFEFKASAQRIEPGMSPQREQINWANNPFTRCIESVTTAQESHFDFNVKIRVENKCIGPIRFMKHNIFADGVFYHGSFVAINERDASLKLSKPDVELIPDHWVTLQPGESAESEFSLFDNFQIPRRSKVIDLRAWNSFFDSNAIRMELSTQVTLLARRSSGEDLPAREDLGRIVFVKVPSKFTVKEGNAGNGVAELKLSGGPNPVTCTFKGRASTEHPTLPKQIALGLEYRFQSCTSGVRAGGFVQARNLQLQVISRDAQAGSTAIEQTLPFE